MFQAPGTLESHPRGPLGAISKKERGKGCSRRERVHGWTPDHARYLLRECIGVPCWPAPPGPSSYGFMSLIYSF